MAAAPKDLSRSFPAVVGVATAEQSPTEPGEGLDCASLMIDAAQRAVAGAGGRVVGSMVDLVLATQGLSMLTDAAGRVATASAPPPHGPSLIRLESLNKPC